MREMLALHSALTGVTAIWHSRPQKTSTHYASSASPSSKTRSQNENLVQAHPLESRSEELVYDSRHTGARRCAFRSPLLARLSNLPSRTPNSQRQQISQTQI